MSNTLDLVLGVVTLGVYTVTKELLELAWDPIIEPVLEFILGWFGIEDEDVISTSVSTQRIIADDLAVDNMMTQLALLHQKDPDVTVIEKFLAVSSSSRDKYAAYFRYGRDKYDYGLPDSNLRGFKIDNIAVKEVLDTLLSTSVTLTHAEYKVPTKEEWVGYTLQGSHNYKLWSNELDYLGDVYKITYIDYNYTYNRYDVGITSYEDKTTIVTTITTITVTNIDAATDNVNTVVSEQTEVTGTKSGLISDITIELSNTNEIVPIGTVENSEVVTTSTTYEYNIVYATAVIYVDSYTPIQYYVVKYYTTDNTQEYYWLYDPETNVYPTLEISNTYVTNLDMLPVIILRNSTVNTNTNQTSDLYLQTNDLCNFLGVDINAITDSLMENPDIANVEDAFIHFGVNPQETDKTTSKVLYKMFEYIQNDDTLIESVEAGVTKYSATFKEGPMNLGMAWTNQTRSVISGVLGPIGSYYHSIVGKSIIMKKQTGPEHYTQIRIDDVSTITLIDRQGLWGAVGKSPSDSGFFIPLPYYFVQQLSGLEQAEIFVRSMLLSVYAAEVTHLEWYETEAFISFLQVVAIIVIVVVTIFTAGTGTSWAQIALDLLVNMAIGYLTSIALQKLFEQTSNSFLRTVIGVLIVAAAAYSQQSYTAGEFLTAAQLTSTVTSMSTMSTINMGVGIVNMGTQISGMLVAEQMEELAIAGAAFAKAAEARSEEYESAQEGLNSGISTDFAGILKRSIETSAYLEGVDVFIYRSVQIQYDYNLLYDYSSMKDDYYNNKLRLGIV